MVRTSTDGLPLEKKHSMTPTATAALPDVRTEIAGMPVTEIARRFGTPTFVYESAMIQERIDDLRAFDTIRYAQKANSNLAVLDLVRRQGVLVDAVSAGEVGRAMAAGYLATGDPPPIVYTSDIFDRETLDLVVEKGIAIRNRSKARRNKATYCYTMVWSWTRCRTVDWRMLMQLSVQPCAVRS